MPTGPAVLPLALGAERPGRFGVRELGRQMGHHCACHLEAACQAVHETSCLPGELAGEGEAEGSSGQGPRMPTMVTVTRSAVPQHSQASLGGV